MMQNREKKWIREAHNRAVCRINTAAETTYAQWIAESARLPRDSTGQVFKKLQGYDTVIYGAAACRQAVLRLGAV